MHFKLSDPSLLFLDEPTSGLDSTTSRHIVEALNAQARRGVNVVVVLHQPSFPIFRSFTHVLLLGVGGRVVYHGGPEAAEAYFCGDLGYELPPYANPADFYLELISGGAAVVVPDRRRAAAPSSEAPAASGRAPAASVPGVTPRAAASQHLARTEHHGGCCGQQEPAHSDGSLRKRKRCSYTISE